VVSETVYASKLTRTLGLEMKKYKAVLSVREFIIEQDLPDVGYYLYVYENGKCIKDYLQNNLPKIMKQAEELYGIKSEMWKEIEEKK
jgi:hypothetical protein